MPPPSPLQPAPPAAGDGDDVAPAPAPTTRPLHPPHPTVAAALVGHPVGVSAAFLRRLADDMEGSKAFGTVKCHRNIQCSDCGVSPVIGGLHHGEEAWRHEPTGTVDKNGIAQPPPKRVVTEVRAGHISYLNLIISYSRALTFPRIHARILSPAPCGLAQQAGLDLCDDCFGGLPKSDQSAFIAVADCAELGIYKGGLTQLISNLPCVPARAPALPSCYALHLDCGMPPDQRTHC